MAFVIGRKTHTFAIAFEKGGFYYLYKERKSLIKIEYAYY
jgi:hypothetical protein